MKQAIPIILAHHEHYIKRTAGPEPKDIPLGARIVAVADAYDAITTDRPYRRGRPAWQAVGEISKASGTQFDPVVVEAFQRVSKNTSWRSGSLW